MKHRGVLVLGLLLLAGTSLLSFPQEQSGSREPAAVHDVEYAEEVQVRLVLLDVVVLDASGRAVPDLTRDDFEIVAGGDRVPLETLDIECRAEPAGGPQGTEGSTLEASPAATRGPRRIVLALDYQHLTRTRRFRVLEQVIAMVRDGAADGDEMMVVALNGGLRIEQRFTQDVARIVASLERMQYDVSLWQPEFQHLNESGFVGGMTAMLEFLGTVPGPKAVVLFSEMGHVPLELQFQDIAAVAAAARCSIYPVDVSGLVPVEAPELGFPAFVNTVSAREKKTRSGGLSAGGG